ncbi:MAG: RHS repeat-associated core domain-containing protein, partial [Candidatus Marinimicrobia bacterium]|nr:RHS repeat-associated core domain-containing protein [Candidatus Neomarinimicrobiota bacterium]
ESGTIVESYMYDAWGNLLGVYDSADQPLTSSTIGNRYLFHGREYSFATGLYNFRARWYDPTTGRWLSKDPIGISGGLNQYVAFGNNPVMFVDPFGKEARYKGPRLSPAHERQARLKHELLYGPDSSYEDARHERQTFLNQASDSSVDLVQKITEYAVDPYRTAVSDVISTLPGGKLYNEAYSVDKKGIKDWAKGKGVKFIINKIFEGVKNLTRWPDDNGKKGCE